MRNVCQKEVITFKENSQEEEAREEKMGATEDQALTIQRRSLNMKISTLEELLIHLSIWIRNDAIMNEEDD